MAPLDTWEKVLLGLVAVLVVVWFWPGVKGSLERSRQAEAKDWKAAVLPLALVALFVLLLIGLL
jgi:hypothetical protein